ncbi:SOS response-associated peptidase [Aestuariibius sp. 2305UL40-4]|uniref:SOS response-associated peptidase n=1 Tax=Aestuariibius violaceus TaxID=3234132 RepID=UPI00345E78A3
MPGRFFLTSGHAEICTFLCLSEQGAADPPRLNIAPGEELCCRVEDRLERMRWGLIPQGRTNARGRPVMEVIVNARSETLFAKSAFQGVRRCIVPVNGWYEWTGETRRKTAWSIKPKDGGLLAFAAIYDVWHGPGGVEVPQFATVTCEPNADVKDIHHRMGVILAPDDFDTWLFEKEEAVQELMRPWPDGALLVEKAVDLGPDGPRAS